MYKTQYLAEIDYMSNKLVSRRGAWVTLGLALIIMTTFFGVFSGSKAPQREGQAPVDSESMQVAALLQEFDDAATQSVLIVAVKDDGSKLSGENIKSLDVLLPILDKRIELSQNTNKDETAIATTSGPMLSDDGEAAVIITPIEVGDSNTETAEIIKAIRTDLADATPAGIVTHVTGGPAFGADIASAFDGADFTLLLATILIVAILLIVTYRSPILWLIPLTVVALADGLAGRITAAAGEAWELEFDSGIISVLVFGAGTNYALLLISRYREELAKHADHRDALAVAWRKTVPAILASNVTVVLALLTLLLATIPLTRGLGIPAAIGLIIAMAAAIFVLPSFLAVCGRRIFWPFIPKHQEASSGESETDLKINKRGSIWRSIALKVVGRPVVSLIAGALLLAIMATGLIGTSVGLDQMEKFRTKSDSAIGLEVLSKHFPAGEAAPIFVITKSESAKEILTVVTDLDGVVRAHPVGISPDETLTKIMITSEYAPSSDESLDQIVQIRDYVHGIKDSGALVGGSVATDLDARSGNQQDLLLIAPLVLGVSFIVLLVLLRSFLAPVLLLIVNLASAIAAIGAGAWLSRVLFDQNALDLQVPVLAFLFLVALGIDYTIFLVHRARTEAIELGTRPGMIEAVTHTGSVITSAGIVLAAVFAALGLLPLVTLGQLGLIVGVGVIVDTLIVRTVIVPAIFSLVGNKIWWPSKIQN